MADDADLLISAGFSDAKLAAEVNKLVGKFADAGKRSQEAFNKTAEKAVENSQVVKANAREIERLKRAYDPLYAASKRYEGELEKLNRAHKVGAINAKQHEAALERLNAEFQGSGDVAEEAGRGASRFGGALGQVGFQIGDFATQVGAGTSATQALGQQLPQLLGAFGTFGALAGAGAAVLIPLGAALIRAATDSASLEERMDALTKSTDSYVSAAQAAATPVDELRAKFGNLADEVARVGAINASAIDTIKQFEGFQPTAKWDVNAYRAGFGSDTVTLADGTIQKVVQGLAVSLEDANRDLARRVGEFQEGVIGQIGGDRFGSFTQEQQAALTSIAYNYGTRMSGNRRSRRSTLPTWFPRPPCGQGRNGTITSARPRCSMAGPKDRPRSGFLSMSAMWATPLSSVPQVRASRCCWR